MDILGFEEKIAEIEEEIKKTPYHKGTEHHIGQLKARLAKLKAQLKSHSGRRKGLGFAFKKEGDATVVLIGPPSVGKSTLLNQLTRAKSKVASYPFTTLKVIPGMLEYQGARIQIFDIPGLMKGAAEGKGKGREILAAARVADLLLLMASIENPASFKLMEDELEAARVRLPRIKILSKIDLVSAAMLSDIQAQLEKCVPVSAKKKIGLEKLKKEIFSQLKLIRVYLKKTARGKIEEKPLICKKGTTIFEAASKISHSLAEEVRAAQIVGPSAKYPGQLVGFNHRLTDQDQVYFVKRSAK